MQEAVGLFCVVFFSLQFPSLRLRSMVYLVIEIGYLYDAGLLLDNAR